MTVSSAVRKAGPYTGTGLVSTYSFAFKVYTKNDIQVIRADLNALESTLVLDSDYVVTLNVDQEVSPGGSITLKIGGVTTTTLTSGYKLTIIGNLIEQQQTDITNLGGFFPQTIEDMADRAVILIQQLEEKVDRAFLLPATSSASAIDLASEIEAVTLLATNFLGLYYGAYASNPSVDPLGNPPNSGDMYYNTTTHLLMFYDANLATWTSQPGNAALSSNIFSGNGVNKNFVLSTAPSSVTNMIVFVGGVAQRPTTDYSVAGTTLTFVVAPPNAANNVLAFVVNFVTIGTINFNNVDIPQTGSELAVTVTPVSRQYAECHAFRYMSAAQIASVLARDLVQDVTIPLANALLVGKELYLPDGDYKITSGLIAAIAGQSIRGQSRGAIIRTATDFTALTKAASFINFSNFTVVGQAADTTSTSAGVLISNCTRSSDYFVMIQGFGYGYAMQGATSNWVNNIYSPYLYVNKRAGIYTCGHGANIYGGEIAGSVFGLLQAKLQAGAALKIDRDFTSDLGDSIGIWGTVIESIGSTATTKTVTGAVNNGAGAIRLTVVGHGRSTGDHCSINTVGGVPNATGVWAITVIDANTVDLIGSTFGGAFTVGGTLDFGAVIYNGVGFTGVRARNIYVEDTCIGYVVGDSFKNDGITAHSATVDSAVMDDWYFAETTRAAAGMILSRGNSVSVRGNYFVGANGTLINSKNSNLAGSCYKDANQGWNRDYDPVGAQVMQGPVIDPICKNGSIVWRARIPATVGGALTPAITISNYGNSLFGVDINVGFRTTGLVTFLNAYIGFNGLQGTTSFANDAAAAAGGVAVGQGYRNGSVVQVRIV